MRRRPITLVLLLLAAAAAGAEGQGGAAPLESSKQALKTLRSDHAAKDSATATGKLSDGLPRLETPVPGAAAQELSPSADAQRKKQDLKKERQKNWLLDGVEELSRGAKSRDMAGEKDPASPTDEEEVLDSSDPAYVLRLYADRQKKTEAKNTTRQSAEARRDPIAPFLQGWLGNSPVRGKFFDEFVRRTDDSSPAAASAGFPGTDLRRNAEAVVTIEGGRAAPAGPPQSNPYLAGLGSPAMTDAGNRLPDASLFAPAVSDARPEAAPTASAGDLLPTDQPAAKKAPFPAISDNEKYFPQQKKF